MQSGALEGGAEGQRGVEGVESGDQVGVHRARGLQVDFQVGQTAGCTQLDPLAGQRREDFRQVQIGGKIELQRVVAAQRGAGLELGVGIGGGHRQGLDGNGLAAGIETQVQTLDVVVEGTVDGGVLDHQLGYFNGQWQGDLRQHQTLTLIQRDVIGLGCGPFHLGGGLARQRRAHRDGGVDGLGADDGPFMFGVAQSQHGAGRQWQGQMKTRQARRSNAKGIALGHRRGGEAVPGQSGAVGQLHGDVLDRQFTDLDGKRQRQGPRLGTGRFGFDGRLLRGFALAQADVGTRHPQVIKTQPAIKNAVLCPGQRQRVHRQPQAAHLHAKAIQRKGVEQRAFDRLVLEKAHALALIQRHSGAPGTQHQAANQQHQANQGQRQPDQQTCQGPQGASFSH